MEQMTQMAQAITGSGFLKDAGSEPLDNGAYIRRQVQWYNESPGKLAGYDCPVCRNKGSIAFVQDGDIAMTMRPCGCMKKRQALRNVRRSDLSANLEHMRFQTYGCSAPWQTEAKEKAVEYCREKGAPWFYIAGQSGAGKTHLCTAICGELLKRGIQVQYSQWASVYREMQSFQKRDECFQRLCRAQVLYLDDFLKIGTPEKSREVAFEILNERYLRGKATILSSEVSITALYKQDEAIAGRIAERCENGKYCVDIRRGSDRNYRVR